jgi:hypothetical protein
MRQINGILLALCICITISGCKWKPLGGTSSGKSDGSDNFSRQSEGASEQGGNIGMCRMEKAGQTDYSGCYCYPDIVPKLTITLRNLVQKFRSGQGLIQTLNCTNLLGEFSESFGGWDLDFPTDYKSENLPGLPRPVATPCGTCVYPTGTKVCYEAKILGNSYFYDVWDVNYALYGTLQKLCDVAEVDAWAKVRGWKALKGQYSDRVWFWFRYGYSMADSNLPSTADGLFSRLEIPPSDPRYVNKCASCPGEWRNPAEPLSFKSYVIDSKVTK